MEKFPVVWLFGLSGVGKTSIAKTLMGKISQKFIHIDGDEFRKHFSQDLSFSMQDRIENIKRIQRLSKFLNESSLGVVISALYFDQDLANWNLSNFPNYIEVHVHAPIDVLKKRNTKGLYNETRKNVVGMDIKWTPPTHSSLEIDTSISSQDEAVSLILEVLESRV